jgi:homeodomain-containing protein
MSRRKTHPLRILTDEERVELEGISRERSAAAEWVIRARIVLSVSQGKDYQVAAADVGRRDGDRVAALVERFNQEGLTALESRHGGGPQVVYGVAERERILREVRRQPTCEGDGTARWSLSTLQRTLREAGDGLPRVSEYTIRKVLLEAGYDWQHSRSWCQTGQVVRKRKAGSVVVTDPDGEAKKN